MPRTKVARNKKRNREAADEELVSLLREFDATYDEGIFELEMMFQKNLDDLTFSLKETVEKFSHNTLKIKVGDLMEANVKTFAEFEKLGETSVRNTEVPSISSTDHSCMSARKISREDEGYLTEESGGVNSKPLTATKSINTRSAVTPLLGPLGSAKAKTRRRSRSACDYLNNAMKKAVTASASQLPVNHTSRSKLRTPQTARRYNAISADRNDVVQPKVTPNTPISLLRYPRAGELVISLSGSPLVPPMTHDPCVANVNIPLGDKVFSLRPEKLQGVDEDIITQINAETLDQIKQLQSNLNVIMKIADRGLH